MGSPTKTENRHQQREKFFPFSASFFFNFSFFFLFGPRCLFTGYICVDFIRRDDAYASFDPKYWHTMRPRRSNNNDSYEFLSAGRWKSEKLQVAGKWEFTMRSTERQQSKSIKLQAEWLEGKAPRTTFIIVGKPLMPSLWKVSFNIYYVSLFKYYKIYINILHLFLISLLRFNEISY